MKKIALGLLTISLFLSSCTDDKKEEIIHNDASIVGIWKIQKSEVLSGKDLNLVIKEYLPDECKLKSAYQFSNNGKYIIKDFNLINGECKETSGTKNYQYNSVDKKIIIEGAKEPAIVLDITNNKLIFYINDQYDHNDDGTDDYLRYTFVK